MFEIIFHNLGFRCNVHVSAKEYVLVALVISLLQCGGHDAGLFKCRYGRYMVQMNRCEHVLRCFDDRTHTLLGTFSLRKSDIVAVDYGVPGHETFAVASAPVRNSLAECVIPAFSKTLCQVLGLIDIVTGVAAVQFIERACVGTHFLDH